MALIPMALMTTARVLAGVPTLWNWSDPEKEDGGALNAAGAGLMKQPQGAQLHALITAGPIEPLPRPLYAGAFSAISAFRPRFSLTLYENLRIIWLAGI